MGKKDYNKYTSYSEEINAVEPEMIDEPANTNSYGKVIICPLLNVRSDASYESEILTVISNGDTVEIIAEKNDFYNVVANGVIGYVAKKFIEK